MEGGSLTVEMTDVVLVLVIRSKEGARAEMAEGRRGTED